MLKYYVYNKRKSTPILFCLNVQINISTT